MTTSQLATDLRLVIGKQPATELAYQVVLENFPVHDLIDLCFDRDKKTGFHAAWVLEQICTGMFDYFLPGFPLFVKRFHEVKHPSVKRHWGKILLYSLKQFQKPIYKKQAQQFWVKPHEALVAALFEWLIDPAVRPGVKVWCMDVLDMFTKQYPWIYDELLPTVQALMADATPGLLSRGKKLLEKSVCL